MHLSNVSECMYPIAVFMQLHAGKVKVEGAIDTLGFCENALFCYSCVTHLHSVNEQFGVLMLGQQFFLYDRLKVPKHLAAKNGVSPGISFCAQYAAVLELGYLPTEEP